MPEANDMKTACAECPWRLANQGKRHKFGFYRLSNVKRLWNQLRRGGGEQSCHKTDPSHPDHIATGTKPNAKAQECPGSVIVVLREVQKMADGNTVSPESLKRYQATRKKGLTKTGILFWVVQRIQLAGAPFVGGAKLPEVDVDDKEIGLPECLREG